MCDDSWDNLDAKVVCRQHGFSDVSVITTCCAYFGQGLGSKLLHDVRCSGNETSLDQCQHSGWRGHNCQYHREDAGVICGNGTGKYMAVTYNTNSFCL